MLWLSNEAWADLKRPYRELALSELVQLDRSIDWHARPSVCSVIGQLRKQQHPSYHCAFKRVMLNKGLRIGLAARQARRHRIGCECMPREALEEVDIKRLIERSNATILDIGTNNGDMSDNFSKWFPYAQIFSFEPDPRAIKKMRARNLSTRIHLFEKALGQSVGTAIFHQSAGKDLGAGVIDRETGLIEEWDQSGSLRAPKEHLELFPWISFENKIEVEVTTLDAWCEDQKVKYIDFIWADVQGAEEDLIRGGLQALGTTRYFYTEFSDREIYENSIGLQGILDLLPNFDIVEVFQRDVLLRNRHLWR